MPVTVVCGRVSRALNKGGRQATDVGSLRDFFSFGPGLFGGRVRYAGVRERREVTRVVLLASPAADASRRSRA